MEAHAAFVWANRGVKLHAPGAVNLHLIAIVNPDDAELDDALRFDQAFQQIELTIARILFKERPQSGHHFADGLGEFSLMRVALLNAGEKTFQSTRLIHRCNFPLRLWLLVIFYTRP